VLAGPVGAIGQRAATKGTGGAEDAAGAERGLGWI